MGGPCCRTEVSLCALVSPFGRQAERSRDHVGHALEMQKSVALPSHAGAAADAANQDASSDGGSAAMLFEQVL